VLVRVLLAQDRPGPALALLDRMHAAAAAQDRADAVLSGLDPRSNSDAESRSQGTRAIVAAMKATGVLRIVVVSAAPVGTVTSPGHPEPPKHDPGCGFFMRHLFSRLAKTMFGKVYADLAVMEYILRDSGLDWTIIRPPQLTDKPLAAATGQSSGATSGAAGPFHGRCRQFMLRTLGQPGTIGHVIGIAS
jgi:nucleoside-diphosphate-sugar epimerase